MMLAALLLLLQPPSQIYGDDCEILILTLRTLELLLISNSRSKQAKKVKVAHTRLPSVGFRSWSRFLAVSLQVTWVLTLKRAATNCQGQEAQLSQRDRAMRRVSWNLANCHATVQKLLVWQAVNQVSAVANWPVRQNRTIDSAWWYVR